MFSYTTPRRFAGLSFLIGALCASGPGIANAKLPAPSPEAKAKADEAKAKAEFGDKIAAYKLCQAQDRVAATYLKAQAAAGKPATPTPDLPACKDPGTYEATQDAARVGVADSLPLNNEPVKK